MAKPFKFTKRQRKALRKAWVKALRSGEYKQGSGQLEDPKGHCCCLGVLCRVFDKKYPGVLTIAKSSRSDTEFDTYSAYTPPIVKDAIGLKSESGLIQSRKSLSEMNDDGKSFKQIALVIEREPAGLFVD